MGPLVSLLIVLAVAAALAYPLWRPEPEPPAEPAGPGGRLLALQERKRALYAAIREMGFDYRTGKLLEEDYRRGVERLKAEAAEVVRAIEELRSKPPRGPAGLEAEIARARTRLQARSAGRRRGTAPYCTGCGRRAEPGDRYCAACGTPLRRDR